MLSRFTSIARGCALQVYLFCSWVLLHLYITRKIQLSEQAFHTQYPFSNSHHSRLCHQPVTSISLDSHSLRTKIPWIQPSPHDSTYNSCQEATLLLQLWILPCLPQVGSGGTLGDEKMYPPMTSREGCPTTPWKLWDRDSHHVSTGVPFNHPYLPRPTTTKQNKAAFHFGRWNASRRSWFKYAVIIDDKSLLGNQVMAVSSSCFELGSLRKFSLFNRKNQLWKLWNFIWEPGCR